MMANHARKCLAIFVVLSWPLLCRAALGDLEGGISRQAETLLASGMYDELEELAREYRDSRARVQGGNAKLYHFYGGLGSHAEQPLFSYSSNVPFTLKREHLEHWLAARPKSVAARVALAQFWVHAAWIARGAQYARDVHPARWAVFTKRLKRAAAYLRKVDPASDAHAYYVLMALATGLSRSRADLDAIYQRAIRTYPGYYHYYGKRAEDLQEKWFGEDGELPAYLDSLLTDLGEEDGLVAYSYVAYRLMFNVHESDLYRTTGLSWARLQAAYAMRAKRYGMRMQDWNALCRFAVIARDRSFASNALDHVGENWDPDVWGTREYFDRVVAWIRGN